MNLLKDEVSQLIKKLAIPASVGTLFQTLYTLVDTFYAGKISPEALSALSKSFPIYFLIIATSIGVTVAGTSLIGSSIGEKNEKNVLGYFTNIILYSVIIALIFSSIYYLINKILTIKEIISYTIKGMSGMMSLSLLIMLAFAIGNLCNELGTGIYVSNSLKDILSPELVPFLLFITSCFISFSTGTSWGTFAIMIAIAVPISNEMGINSSLAIAASLGGGLFGDHCSPISDTSVISSMASASDHIDHVKTQLPYALISGLITAILYLIIGFSY